MELGDNWQQNFKKFDFDACNGASLGQVQKAVTKNGENVACKFAVSQYRICSWY